MTTKDKDLAHLAAIVRDSDDAIIGKTLEAIITSWNKGAERIYGYTAEEAIGRTIAMLVPPDREDELPNILRRVAQGEGINHYDTLRVTKDGRLVNISLTVSPIRDAYGTLTGISTIGRDVTKQKEDEQALRESAKAYKLLMEQASDAIMISYPDQPLIEVNQRASDMLGYTREELLLLRAESNALREDLTVLPFRPDEILEGDIVYAERPVRRKDGTIIVTELSTRRLDDGRIVTIARDVTARKQAEEANKKLLAEVDHERKRLDAILSSVPGIVWETWFHPDDSKMRTSYVSSYMESMLGYTTQQWLGTPGFWLSVIHPEDREEIRQVAAERLAEGKGGTLQFRWVKADGQLIWVETTTTVIFSDDGIPVGIRGITVDITERRRIDEQIQAQAQMLNQVQAAVVATDMGGNVTHWNRYAETLFGWQSKEVLGQRVDSFIVGPSDIALSKEIMAQVRSEGWWEGEFTIRRKDGSIFPAYVVDTLIHDQAGQAIGMVGISVDITQRRQTEEAIDFERYLLNSLMESTPDSIYFKDAESKFTRVNRALAVSIGLVNPAEALGRSDFDFFSEELARSTYHDEQEIIRTGQALFLKEEHEVWPDGHETWSLSTKMPLHDALGNINGTFGVTRDVTKQKDVEVSLRESEERFRLMFASNPLPMWVYDAASLQFLEVNDAAIQRYGYSRNEFLSMLITDIRSPEEAARLLSNMDHIRADLQLSGEWKHLTKDGQLLDMQITSHTITFDGHQPSKAAILVVAEDITDRKRSEEALRASERKFRAIFESTVDAMYITDETGTFVDVNSAASKLAGLPAEQLVGHNYMEIKAWKTASGLGSLVDQVIARGTVSGDLQILDASGETRDIEYSTVANFIPGNYLSVARDLTERRRAEASLRASEIRYRSLVETSPDAITVTDLQGVIVVCNQQAVALHGYSSIEDMLGRHAFDMLAPEDHQRAADDMGNVASSGVVRNLEYTSVRKDGSRFPSEINGTILLDTEGKPTGIMSIMRDITEQRRAEGARLAQDAAEQANRAKSVFLSRMSHELRTPLNAILGFGQLLQMDSISQEQHESVDYIIKAGQHLLSLINEVLDIARIEEGNLTISLEPVNVQDVIQSCLELVQPLAARSHITVTIDDDELADCFVRADRQRLQQVMLNLLANAIKYNHDGGAVHVSCAIPQPASNEQGPGPGSKLRIAVCDTGIGISPEMLTRLFVPFERLGAERSDVEGTGLGLALSKQLVEAMGGTIGVVSEKGTGSTFWVELSSTSETVPEDDVMQTSPLGLHQIDKATRTLLYIEDNLSNLRLIEGVLKKRPWIKLITAMQGQMGLDLAYEHQPDVILLDLHLPDISGSEVLRQLHANPRTASIPVVMLSADANQQQIDKLLNLGARAYLTKPLNIKQLLDALEENMTGKQAK